MRTEVDAHMHPTAICIALAFNSIAIYLCSRYITQYPRMDGDACEHAIVAFTSFDRVIGDDCILAAKENDRLAQADIPRSPQFGQDPGVMMG